MSAAAPVRAVAETVPIEHEGQDQPGQYPEREGGTDERQVGVGEQVLGVAGATTGATLAPVAALTEPTGPVAQMLPELTAYVGSS